MRNLNISKSIKIFVSALKKKWHTILWSINPKPLSRTLWERFSPVSTLVNPSLKSISQNLCKSGFSPFISGFSLFISGFSIEENADIFVKQFSATPLFIELTMYQNPLLWCRLNIQKNSRMDDIPAIDLRNFFSELAPVLSRLFQLSY